MKRDQLAINSVSTKNADLPTCLAAYEAAGFRNVEFALFHVKDYLNAGHTLSAVRQLLANHQLRCIGGFETPVLCFAEADKQAANHAQIIANAQLLAELGASVLVVGTDGPANPAEAADPLGQAAEVFAQLGDQVAGVGITLCIEFNWSPLVKSLRSAAEIARRAGRENVGVLFDPAHYHCTPTKFDQLDAANVALIRHVHVDDMQDKPGELSNCNADRVLPGQGCLDLAALFGRIEEHGYTGYFSIELFNEDLWAQPADEAARQMYQSLLPLISQKS